MTVNPVRVADISGFGTLEAVGEKLLEAERKKVGGSYAYSLKNQPRRNGPQVQAFNRKPQILTTAWTASPPSLKDGTLAVSMVAQASRRTDSGALLYDYEYDLDSTRQGFGATARAFAVGK